jgi:hypothetical protein
MDPSDRSFALRIRMMQIICGALMFGVSIATVIFIVLVAQRNGPLVPQPQAGAMPVISMIAIAMLGLCLVLSFVIPAAILRSSVRQLAARGSSQTKVEEDESGLLAIRQTTLIIAYALLEGPGFFCAIAYLLEAQVYTLVGVGVVLVVMMLRFPTMGRICAWLEQQVALVSEIRQLGAAMD